MIYVIGGRLSFAVVTTKMAVLRQSCCTTVSLYDVCLSVSRTIAQNGTFWTYDCYRTLIGSHMLEVEPTGQRGRMANRSGRNDLDDEKLTTSVSQKPSE